MNLRPLVWKGWLRARGDMLARVASIREWETLSREEVESRQRERLEHLIAHAHRKVPYYNSALEKAGAIVNGRVHLDRFARIPLLDKPTLRNHFRDLLAAGHEKRGAFESSSSGSTGEPVRFVQDREYREWNQAVAATFNRWVGYQAGFPQVRLWGAERDVKAEGGSLRGRIGRWLRNETWLSTFRMSPDRIRHYVDIINRIKPNQIFGYVEGLNEIARLIGDEGLTVHSPASVVASAETLYRSARQRISRAFRATVSNRYGSSEMGPIASEDAIHEGLTISAPTHYVEILRSDGNPAAPGEIGEIVVTLLTNFSMPLIRYRMGDVGAWQTPIKSRRPAWPGLLEVFGRTSDILIAEDGTHVHSNSLLFIFDPLEFISRFQIVQETPRNVAISIVLTDPVPDPLKRYTDELEAIVAAFRRALGPGCEVSFAFVDEIRQTISGKYRHVISKVTYG